MNPRPSHAVGNPHAANTTRHLAKSACVNETSRLRASQGRERLGRAVQRPLPWNCPLRLGRNHLVEIILEEDRRDGEFQAERTLDLSSDYRCHGGIEHSG